MEKKYYFGGAGLVIIILLLIWFFGGFKSCKGPVVKKQPGIAAVDSSEVSTSDSLKAKTGCTINNGKTIIIVPPGAEITIRTPGVPVKVSEVPVRTIGPKSPAAPRTTSRRVTEKQMQTPFGGGSETQRSFGGLTQSGKSVNTGLNVSFEGIIDPNSLVGTTCTGERNILFYIKDEYLKKNGMTFPAPRFGTENGPEFTLDASSGNWYYIKPGSFVSPDDVNNSNRVEYWTVCIGPIDGYNAYLPHETLKQIINQVRGKTDGITNMQELYKMHQIDNNIWTDRNASGVYMPKSFNPTPGAKEKGIVTTGDGLQWEGWDFKTRIDCKVQTQSVR